MKLFIAVMLALATGFAAGILLAGRQHAATERPFEYWSAVAELDSVELNGLVRNNMMESGRYEMRILFPGEPEISFPFDLTMKAGHLETAPVRPGGSYSIQSLAQEGSRISWEEFDMDEGPTHLYAGLIDGTEAWGRVYRLPCTGWHEGPPAIGFWRLRTPGSVPVTDSSALSP